MKLQVKNYSASAWAIAFLCASLAAFTVTHAQTTIAIQMEPGDSGSQVSALQSFLAADSSVYPEALVTGYYGSLTTSAVERYQCKQGIVCEGDVSSTGYGRVGPSTLAKIQMQLGIAPGAGVQLPNTGMPPVPVSTDPYAPFMSSATVATSSTSVAIHWVTNEPARSRVMYSTVWPFVLSVAPSFGDATVDNSSDVVITGLIPNTRYYFVPESVDASGNVQWSINHSFVTGQ